MPQPLQLPDLQHLMPHHLTEPEKHAHRPSAKTTATATELHAPKEGHRKADGDDEPKNQDSPSQQSDERSCTRPSIDPIKVVDARDPAPTDPSQVKRKHHTGTKQQHTGHKTERQTPNIASAISNGHAKHSFTPGRIQETGW
ncbi:hypothetical protein [Streptomyces sp.]|uniref:hypothetical protein n=1 Tax=Streptomyces sp. TaxID=1931 RepID=UPI002D78E071|nr:hypothetical protein [Streptomyces sp.]HET6355967.1 hypothetical protein [Streptomyces sp.]